jgi:hypothetical protein
VVEAAGDLGLPDEAGDLVAHHWSEAGEDLERHAPVQAGVVGKIDDALPAPPDLLDDAVGTDGRDVGRGTEWTFTGFRRWAVLN